MIAIVLMVFAVQGPRMPLCPGLGANGTFNFIAIQRFWCCGCACLEKGVGVG